MRNPLVFILFASLPLVATVSGCFTAKPASGALDLSNLPQNVAALVPVSGPSPSFGTVAVSGSVDQTVVLGNGGHYPAASIQADASNPITAPFTFKGGSFPGTGGTCDTGTPVSPNNACTLVLSFSPTTTGDYTGNLSLLYNNGVLMFPLVLALSGQTPADVEGAGTPPYGFGSNAAGTAFDLLITVRNQGFATATGLQASVATPLVAPFSYKGGSYPGSGGSCGATLAPAATCGLAIRYQSAVSGSFSGTLALTYNNGIAAATWIAGLTGSTP